MSEQMIDRVLKHQRRLLLYFEIVFVVAVLLIIGEAVWYFCTGYFHHLVWRVLIGCLLGVGAGGMTAKRQTIAALKAIKCNCSEPSST